LAGTEGSVFLFDKEEGGGLWGYGMTNISFLEVFFDKGIELAILAGCEAVDLSSLWFEIGFEVDAVIPGTGSGESSCGLFVEDREVLMVSAWNLLFQGTGVLFDVFFSQLLRCGGFGSNPKGSGFFFEFCRDSVSGFILSESEVGGGWGFPIFVPSYGTLIPVDDRVLFLEPVESKNDSFFSKSGDEESGSSGSSTYRGLESGEVGDSSFFVQGSIDIKNLDGFRESGDGEFPGFDEFFVDKGIARPAIYEASGFDGFLLLCPACKDLHWNIHSFIDNFGYKYRGELQVWRD
jgi:hypothetical protein